MNWNNLFRLFIFSVIVASSQACTSLHERVDQLEDEVTRLGERYGRTAIVAKSGGDYVDPVSAMDDLANWCDSPLESNPCLMKILPGVYSIGDRALDMQPYVSIEGSGIRSTEITAAGTEAIRGATAELSRLKVTHRPDVANTEEIRTVIHTDGLLKITDVHFDLVSDIGDSGRPNPNTNIVIAGEGGDLSLFNVSVIGWESEDASPFEVAIEGVTMSGGSLDMKNVDVEVEGSFVGVGVALRDGAHRLNGVRISNGLDEDGSPTLAIFGDARVTIANSRLGTGLNIPLNVSSTAWVRMTYTEIDWALYRPEFPESVACAGITLFNEETEFFTNTCP